ncbi:MAG: type II toxin-antitoxin system VapC family toxin [Spirochaetaceae bacterium]
MRVLFDTSVLVAALVDQLSNHQSAFGVFDSYTRDENEGYCSTHALSETYSALTALPLPRRISSVEARMLIEESILGRLEIVELNNVDYMNAIENVSVRGLTSGIIYDALHVEAAKKASCSRIYTYNINHSEALITEGISVSSP